ncbi:MAG: integrase [Rivularia sp. (in: cyanobacteria)]
MGKIKRQYRTISVHQTLQGQLKVNWKREYKNEFLCPQCNEPRIKFHTHQKTLCRVSWCCVACQLTGSLTQRVPAYIFRYRSDLECPNPNCQEIGNDGQKGWIYQIGKKGKLFTCRFCDVGFTPNSSHPSSWHSRQNQRKLSAFKFDEDTWDLRHFYENTTNRKRLHFHDIKPDWYKFQVKKYIQFQINSQSSAESILHFLSYFRQFGAIIQQKSIDSITKINREVILQFLDSIRTQASTTIYKKVHALKHFFEWLELDSNYLIRSRDFPKLSFNESNWLDEVTRKAIEEKLHKIPAPIARHYQVQLWAAARPEDICSMNFDCLKEENGKWYVKFYEHKVARWHQILASRTIRQVIETQQQWIQETFGFDYPYLFCHFRAIKKTSYPTFTNIKPLPEPPRNDVNKNPMVRIIRILIEQEDICDANGQTPSFTGKITRHSRLQEVRSQYGLEAAQLYADHQKSYTTVQHYAPPTKEQIAKVDLPFQELLMNTDNKFLPWQSLPESLLKNPKAHELDLEIAPRIVVYGHCALDPKIPCPVNLFPKCYGCSSFRPSTSKLPLYERQYQGEKQRLAEAEKIGAELALEESNATIEAMDKWLPELKRFADE